MRLFFIAAVFCLSSADKLDNTYLPPQGAQGAGGGPGLATPFGGPRPGGGNGGGGPRPQYGAPSGGGGPGGPSGGAGGAGGGSGEQIPIISMENVNNGDGSYKWSYETGNGIKAQEEGELKPGGEEGIQSVKGSYSYTGPDGQEIKVEYTADENGFVPKGDHLPTSPPIPPEILKSLEQNAAEEAAGGGQGGAGQGGQGGYPSGGPSGGGYPGSGGGGQNGYRY